jgi:hypothetical protein
MPSELLDSGVPRGDAWRMRFTKPLLQLPIRFCADTLAAEVDALPDAAWMPHPQGFAGNEGVPLVSPGGELTDALKGPMAPTRHLLASPYMSALMAELGGVWGRSRLMALAPGAEVPGHVDIHYYWRTHIRIHIPIVTNPGVRFTCGGTSVHMAAGECWIFDSFQPHDVQNQGAERRIHLVLDTVGGERLWELIEAAETGVQPPAEPWRPTAAEAAGRSLAFETMNSPQVMTPWEIRCHVDYLAEHVVPDPALGPVMKRIERFISGWQAAWARFGAADEGLPTYRDLLTKARGDLVPLAGTRIVLRNKAPLLYGLDALIFSTALARDERPAAAPAEPLRKRAAP